MDLPVRLDELHGVLEIAGGDSGKIRRRLLVGAICNLVAGQLPPVVHPRAADPAVAVEHERRVQMVHVVPTLGHAGYSPLTSNAAGPLFNVSAGRTAAAGLRASVAHQAIPVEESPGSMETRWRLTAAGGDPRESATESKPPAVRRQVRVKGCGKSAPRGRRRSRQGKPHREQDQIGVAGRARKRGARSVIRPATRVGCLRRLAMGVPDEWPSRRRKPPDRTRLTGQLAISLRR